MAILKGFPPSNTTSPGIILPGYPHTCWSNPKPGIKYWIHPSSGHLPVVDGVRNFWVSCDRFRNKTYSLTEQQ